MAPMGGARAGARGRGEPGYEPREFAPLGKPDGYPWMEPRSCFRNAFILVTSSSSLRYGEGYALTPIGAGRPVWVHHAWVIDAAGNAVDATWRTAGLRYVGIGISAGELQAGQLRKRKAHLVEPVLATMVPFAADLADVTWELAGWFTGEHGQDREAGLPLEAG